MLKLDGKDPKGLARICHALSTEARLAILGALETQPMSCMELCEKLGLALSTMSVNIRVLEEAGLIRTELVPAKNGSKKMCSLVYRDVSIQLAAGERAPPACPRFTADIPIGNYMDFQVSPSCGFVTLDKVGGLAAAGPFDEPDCFMDPARIGAQLLWFRKGYVEYRIPRGRADVGEPSSISFCLEICSEAPGSNNRWKSDITMWINGVEIGTWTCPGDFGDRRGRLTPEAWGMNMTQYGILTDWTVTREGTFLNGDPLSEIASPALCISRQAYVTMRIGVKGTGAHVGGINLFGDRFGDYPQNIRMTLCY